MSFMNVKPTAKRIQVLCLTGLILLMVLSSACLEQDHLGQEHAGLHQSELSEYQEGAGFENHTDYDGFEGNTDKDPDENEEPGLHDPESYQVYNCDFGQSSHGWPEELLKQGRLGICWKISILNADYYAVPGFSPAGNLKKMDDCLKKKGIDPKKGLKKSQLPKVLECKVDVVGSLGKKVQFKNVPWSYLTGANGAAWCSWISKMLSKTWTGGIRGQAVAWLVRPGARHAIHIKTWSCGPPHSFTGTDPNGVVINGKVDASGKIYGCNRDRLNGYRIENFSVETPPYN